MLKQAIVLVASLVVASSLGDGGQYRTKTSYSKKGFQQQQHFSSGSGISMYQQQKQFAAAPSYGPPSPYSFGYEADGSARQESADSSGKVTGSYTVVNEDGSKRLVTYVADDQGFRAQIDTDEPGTKSDNPADIELKSASKEPKRSATAAATKYSAGWAQQKKFNGPVTQEKITQFGGSISQEKASPYSFNYQNEMADGSSAHRESSDGSGRVIGSYSLSNMDGRRRTVDYSADQSGFKASVDTNEFGTKSASPADVTFFSSARQPSSKQAPQIRQGGSSSAVMYQPSAQAKGQFASNAQISQEPAPYAFQYYSELEDGGSSSRSESADGSGKVVGSYNLYVADGRQRNVEYEADQGGFRASVNTNEFGTKSDSPADVMFYSSAPQEDSKSYQAPSYGLQSTVSSGSKAIFHQQKSPSVPSRQTFAANQYSSFQKQEPIQFGSMEQKPLPYSFSYQNQMDEGSSSRSESLDSSGKVVGSYSLSAMDGRQRTVDYIADEGGFRASVQTNEFGTKSDSPADVTFHSSAPQEIPAAQVAPAKSRIPTRISQQQEPIQFSVGTSGAGARPYAFSYENQMEDGSSAHSESSDGSGLVRGAYSLSNVDGRQRTVKYTSDKAGFQASVDTNEFGTKSESPANVQFRSTSPLVQPQAPLRSQQSFDGSRKKTAFQVTQQKVEQPFPAYPYSFGYEADGSARQEASDDSGKVTGSYTVTNEDGSMRVVEYIADEAGFRAKVKTNEHGTKSDSPADVTLDSSAPEAPVGQKLQQQTFPERTYAPKSSMISQKTIY